MADHDGDALEKYGDYAPSSGTAVTAVGPDREPRVSRRTALASAISTR